MDDAFWLEVDALDATAPSAESVRTGSLSRTLRALSRSDDEPGARSTYHQVLDAIGHDHSGRLDPIAVPAVPLLLRIALEGEPWAQVAAIQVLIDVVGWSDNAARDGVMASVVRVATDLSTLVDHAAHDVGDSAADLLAMVVR
jgi:hypothetical protein